MAELRTRKPHTARNRADQTRSVREIARKADPKAYAIPLSRVQALSTTAGILAARTWLTARALDAPAFARWHATIALATGERPPEPDVDLLRDTRFRIEIYSEEWGFFFCHGGRASWIRVTDIPFVHVRDDFRLLVQTPALKDIGLLMRRLERDHRVAFRRELAAVRTNLDSSELEIRHWIHQL